MNEQLKTLILQRVSYLQKNKPFLTIDADTHLTDMDHLHEAIAQQVSSTPDYYHGRPIGHRELLAEMKQAGVDMCLVWQNPAATVYSQDKIVSLGAIPVFHYGADTEYTPATGLGALATRYPEHPIMAIHMGGGGAGYVEAEQLYHDSRALGLKYPNIKYVLSARRDTHTESDLITYQLAGEPFSKNICCASDAPYGKQSWNFGGYRLMFETLKDGANHPDKRLNENPVLCDDQAVINFMGGNFAELTIWAYRNILFTMLIPVLLMLFGAIADLVYGIPPGKTELVAKGMNLTDFYAQQFIANGYAASSAGLMAKLVTVAKFFSDANMALMMAVLVGM